MQNIKDVWNIIMVNSKKNFDATTLLLRAAAENVGQPIQPSW